MGSFKPRRGFTLIELMLVVAIISLLAAIAIPKFGNLVIKAKEAAIKGHLGSLRSAIHIYYSNNEGFYPQNIVGMLLDQQAIRKCLVPNYIDNISLFEIPTVQHAYGLSSMDAQGVLNYTVTDFWYAAGCSTWKYNQSIGLLSASCSHQNTSGKTWSLE
ncbi:MAG: prepilin-type N-terminal cleavage/methylation domain-containing protein [Elusimicrobia bacterium]|nr:prepilin-type N-terminal cleavage/methylation domain-containing protein [Elusimicrobiota bacterium]